MSVIANAAYGLTGVFTARSVLKRYGTRDLKPMLWVFYVAGLCGVAIFTFAVPSVLFRSTSMGIAIGAMLVIGTRAIVLAPQKDIVDRILAISMVTMAVLIVVRPAATLVGSPQTIGFVDPHSMYVASFKLLALVGWVGFAILFLLRIASDLTADLRDQARRDPMTGLLNRRGFFEQIELDVAQRAARVSCSIVIVDIDHFKSINDRFGHAVGDEVITWVAEILTRLPFKPIVGRIGGEEFVIFLPATPMKAATLLAEGIRIDVAGRYHESLPDSVQVTASFGVAEFRAGDDLLEAMRQADIALYAAKRGGRNRVATSDRNHHGMESLLSIA